jgi:hypothetical protein
MRRPSCGNARPPWLLSSLPLLLLALLPVPLRVLLLLRVMMTKS